MFTGDERRLRISGKTVFFAGIAAGETEGARLSFKRGGGLREQGGRDRTFHTERKRANGFEQPGLSAGAGDGVYSLSISRLEGPGR